RFMSSGPVLVAVLEGDDAIARWRDLMGPTDATKAPKGTIRGEFGTDVEKNAVHGSDAPETARAEIGFFFASLELPGATAGVWGRGAGGDERRAPAQFPSTDAGRTSIPPLTYA